MIDIIRTSASRPEILKKSTDSILKNLKYSGNINWILHEDVLNQTASDECVSYSKSLNIYKEIGINNPPLGHTKSFLWLAQHITSPYFIFWEDDYELLEVFECPNVDCRKQTTNKYKTSPTKGLEVCELCGTKFIESPTDLDTLIKLMDKHKQINEICFPKRDIMPDKADFVKKGVNLDGIDLTVCHHWYVSPAIWRTSFIMPFIEKMRNYTGEGGGWGWHWEINRLITKNVKSNDVNWVEKTLGTYYLGKIRGGQRVYHLGQGDNSIRGGKYKW